MGAFLYDMSWQSACIDSGVIATRRAISRLPILPLCLPREEFAKLVGVDLFRFMESFQKTAVGDHLVVPANVLDRWFFRFQEKYRKDPDFLSRDKEKL